MHTGCWHSTVNRGMRILDPKTNALYFLAISTWILGYPDRAAQLRDESEAHARRLAHPFDLGFVLTEAGYLFNCRGEPHEQLQRLKEAAWLGRENSLPFLMEVLVPVSSGVTSIRKGQAAEGVAL